MPRASRSSGSSSRMRPSRTGRSRGRSPARPTLDMLVVVPAGNDGRAGPSYGSIAGPGGAPAALTVAAADGRLAAPDRPRSRPRRAARAVRGRAAARRRAAETVTAGRRPGDARDWRHEGIAGLFRRGRRQPRRRARGAAAARRALGGDRRGGDDRRRRRRPGRRPPSGRRVQPRRARRRAGRRASGERLVREMRALLAAGVPVTVAVGAVDVVENDAGDSIAAFSSRGLAFGGGPQARSRRGRRRGPDVGARARRRRARFDSEPSAGRASPRQSQRERPRSSRKGGRVSTRSSSTGCSSAPRRGATSTRGLGRRRARPSCGGPAGDRRGAGVALVRRPGPTARSSSSAPCASRTSRHGALRSRDPGNRDRAEGRRDHGRPAACSPAAGPQRGDRRPGRHERALRAGGRRRRASWCLRVDGAAEVHVPWAVAVPGRRPISSRASPSSGPARASPTRRPPCSASSRARSRPHRTPRCTPLDRPRGAAPPARRARRRARETARALARSVHVRPHRAGAGRRAASHAGTTSSVSSRDPEDGTRGSRRPSRTGSR